MPKVYGRLDNKLQEFTKTTTTITTPDGRADELQDPDFPEKKI